MDTEIMPDAVNIPPVIRCRLRFLLAERAEKERRKKPYTIREVAEAVDLSTVVVNRLLNDEFDRIDKLTVDKLCRWGGWKVGDLLEYEAGNDPGSH